MGNKFWAFVNKHFTIPFKFGLLSNPGFLIGNMSDSTLKLTTTMCEKYGTTIEKEAANVAECINASQVLKNDFTDAFKVWKEVSAEYNIRLSPEATVPEIVAMSPKYKEDFLKWLDDSLDVPYTYQNEAGVFVTEYRHVPCELSKEVINNASI
jgi:GH18 family chitinase